MENSRKNYFWNTLSGMINAGQSALILMLIAHFLDSETAGIFSFGYALALLGMAVGKYGVRSFQSSDINEKYSFSDYFVSRHVSLLIAIIGGVVLVIVEYLTGNYSSYKAGSIIAMYLWRQVDVVEDLYYGRYQQMGRLDIGAKCYAIRLAISTAVFCTMIVLRFSFFYTTCAVTIVSILAATILIIFTKTSFSCFLDFSQIQSLGVLRECLPLCVATSLAIYVGNFPKYMIDLFLDEGAQAKFNYLMMPAFVIMLFSNFCFQPLIRKYGVLAVECQLDLMRKNMKRQIVIISLLTLLVLAVAWTLGVQVLSAVFHSDLSPYKMEMMLLILGGGFYAVANYLIIPMTALRIQKSIMWAYIMSIMVGLITSVYILPSLLIMGAALVYIVVNIVLCLFLLMGFLRNA